MIKNFNNIFLFLTLTMVFSEIFMSYFPIGPVPFRNYLTFLGLIILIIEFIILGRFAKGTYLVGLTLILLMGLIFISSIFYQINMQDFFFKITRYLLIPYYIFRISLRAFKSNELNLDKFLKYYVLFVFISSFIAFLQFLEIDFAWRLRQMMPVSYSDINSELYTAIIEEHRPLGMAYYPIALSYQIVWAFPITWYLYKKNFNSRIFGINIFLVLMLIIILGAIASGSRSLIISMIFQIYLIRGLSKKKQILITVLGSMQIIFLFLIAIYFLDFDRWWNLENIINDRFWPFYFGIHFSLEFPFGHGFNWNIFTNYKYIFVPSSIIPNVAIHYVYNYAPHNQFINSLVIYGYFGLLFIIYFYIKIFSKLMMLLRSNFHNNNLIISIISAIFGYLFHSMFHNGGLFIGDYLAWYFLGIIIYLINLSQINK